MCYAEDIVASTIRGTINDVNDANEQLLSNLESFMGELQSQIANVTNEISGITKEIQKIVGSISGAMGFENIKLSIFGCDLSPNVAVSDFYTLDGGGGGQSHSQLPSAESINKSSTVPEEASRTKDIERYALPPKGQDRVDYRNPPNTRVAPTT